MFLKERTVGALTKMFRRVESPALCPAIRGERPNGLAKNFPSKNFNCPVTPALFPYPTLSKSPLKTAFSFSLTRMEFVICLPTIHCVKSVLADGNIIGRPSGGRNNTGIQNGI